MSLPTRTIRPGPTLSSDSVTSRVAGMIGPTDYALRDWATAGLRVPSLFRSFLVTVPRTAVYQVAGHLSDNDWLAVRATLGTALAH